MITIISGTNRNNSNTLQVARIYKSILDKEGVAAEIIDLKELPDNFLTAELYETSGRDNLIYPVVKKVESSEKFVFIIPEYNASFPGVLKAFIDGMDYPNSFRGKVCGIVGLSSGTLGGGLALSHFTDVLHYLGMHVLPVKPRLARIEKIVNNGELTDSFVNQLLHTQAKQLINF